MSILKISEEKVGPSTVINMDMKLDEVPVLPRFCPCCAELADEGAFIVASCKELPPVSFPACEICARHTVIEGRVSSFVGPLIFVLTVLTVVGFLAVRGADKVAQKGGDSFWQTLGGLSALQFPFTSPINAGVTLLGAFGVLIVYLFIYWLVMTPIMRFFEKSSCKWFKQAARTARWYSSDAGGYCRRFIFENPKYAELFRKANSPETKVSTASPGG